MFKIEIYAPNRKEKDQILKTKILNDESHEIFQDLNKLCGGKALHAIAKENEPLIAYEVHKGFTLVFKANKISATFYVKTDYGFGDIRDLGIFTSNKIRVTKPEDAHSALKAIEGIKEAEEVLVISDVKFTQYKKLIEHASTASTASTALSKKEMSPEDLLKKLERQDAIGTKGEDFAIEYEKERLEGLGAKPEHFDEYIIDRRKINVSQGYDIESHFDGQSRYIEVKTTTVNAEADFFFSTNEFNVLKAKGEEAYIYRVVLSEDLESIIEIREIQNPFGDKKTSDFKAIAFKANLKDFEKK